ncbi:MAG: uracil-DNA glycosylase [Candidatus Tectomicrobia bacterium]|nr:uracil-DNA glycosylase [Candidatus Tectomicrobia bacterium]
MASPATLDALRIAYNDCQRCALAQSRQRVVFGYGPPQAPLMLLAERVGGMDEEMGRPFSGPAGELLTRILAAPGVEIPREHVYITNLVLCRGPADRSPRVAEMRACRERLQDEIRLVGPQLLVVLGRLPLQHFLGGKGGLERQRGWWSGASPDLPMPAYVTFNPASALYGDAHDIRRKKVLMYEDWQAIGEAYRALP